MNTEIVNFSLEITNAETLNPNISRYKCYICYPDEPANTYIFSKKVLEDMIPSIIGAGVYTYYSEKLDKFGGHEGNIISQKGRIEKTGELRAIGFVDTATKPFWETRKVNGKEREYLTSYVYLWSGIHPILKDLDKLKIFQSMEVQTAADKINGMMVVKKAIMQRLVLIGDSPAFDGSTFVKFQKEKADENSLLLLKQEFKTVFSKKDIATIIKEREKIKEIENMIVKDKNFTSEEDKVDDLKKEKQKLEEEKDKIDDKLDALEDKIDDNKNDNEDDDDESEFSNAEFSLAPEKWGTGPAIKINKSKEALSNDGWGDVDKTALRWKVLKASNYETLIRSVYLRIGGDWRNSPSSDLSYPVMQIKGGEAVYNSGGLSAALAFARQHNETAVITKVLAIRKKMGIEETTNTVKESFVKAEKAGIPFSLVFNKESVEFVDIKEKVCYQVKDNKISKFAVNEGSTWNDIKDEDIMEEDACMEDFMEYVSCRLIEMEKEKTSVEADIGKKMLDFKAQEDELQMKLSAYEKAEQEKEEKLLKMQKDLEEAQTTITEFQNKIIVNSMNEFIASKKEFEGLFTETEKAEFTKKCITQNRDDTEKMILASFAKKMLEDGKTVGRATFTTMGISQKSQENKEVKKDLYKLVQVDNK